MNYTPKSEDTLLLIGNYTHLLPFIIGGSRLLDYFKPIDRIDQWEGGAYLYQGGYLDVVQKIAKELKEITVIAGEFKTDTLEITLEHNKVL